MEACGAPQSVTSSTKIFSCTSFYSMLSLARRRAVDRWPLGTLRGTSLQRRISWKTIHDCSQTPASLPIFEKRTTNGASVPFDARKQQIRSLQRPTGRVLFCAAAGSSAKGAMATVLPEVAEITPFLIDTRRWFHEHPGLAFEEHGTLLDSHGGCVITLNRHRCEIARDCQGDSTRLQSYNKHC